MLDVKDPTVQEALRRASEEAGLPDYLRSCVYPLLRNPEGDWSPCCGGGCQPCSATLADVAVRTLELLGTPRLSPVPV
ncbi:hypothetical protein [Myxococcus qinghaiensis]|uniref:hypothetical protein n=1 Tax=Myxococcus qinghaiensis TaxID=2906758 RepID=UPI0020A78FCB|nr:hypothetical protein [Myxococcus qinghaiensis]MCP3164984.1 hypothetical protein [Myxococcus qinghaiensis]